MGREGRGRGKGKGEREGKEEREAVDAMVDLMSRQTATGHCDAMRWDAMAARRRFPTID